MNLSALHKACPWCGDVRIQASPHLNKADMKMWRAKCMNCGAGGPVRDEAQEALDSWNERPEVVVPEPLPIPTPKMEPVPMPASLETLATVARRYQELFGHCLCKGDLKCVYCILRDTLNSIWANR